MCLLPIENFFAGRGSHEITKEELNKKSAISVKKSHNAEFLKKQPTFTKKKSLLEDMSIRSAREK